jgi:hypothetical protein
MPNKVYPISLGVSICLDLDSLKTTSRQSSLESDTVSIDSLDLDNFKNWQLDSLESLDSLKNDITTI